MDQDKFANYPFSKSDTKIDMLYFYMVMMLETQASKLLGESLDMIVC